MDRKNPRHPLHRVQAPSSPTDRMLSPVTQKIEARRQFVAKPRFLASQFAAVAGNDNTDNNTNNDVPNNNTTNLHETLHPTTNTTTTTTSTSNPTALAAEQQQKH